MKRITRSVMVALSTMASAAVDAEDARCAPRSMAGHQQSLAISGIANRSQ